MSFPLTLRSAARRAALTSSFSKTLPLAHRTGVASRIAQGTHTAWTARAFASTAEGNGAARSNLSAAGQANTMPIESSMREKLQREFSPEVLNIRNDSSKHAHHAAMVAQGGGNGETHFFVEIIAKSFEGKTQIARHRAINALMKDEFDEGLHALSLRTKTPAEDQKEKEWIKAQTGQS